MAEDIFGPNLGSIKEKTARSNIQHIKAGIDPIPSKVIERHPSLCLVVDIMFVNKVVFLVSMSRELKFGTVQRLDNRQTPIVAKAIKSILALYIS